MAQDVRHRDMTRMVEARHMSGEKQSQNVFILFFSFLRIATYPLWHGAFSPKIKPPGE
jgi:hypothetical protein